MKVHVSEEMVLRERQISGRRGGRTGDSYFALSNEAI